MALLLHSNYHQATNALKTTRQRADSLSSLPTTAMLQRLDGSDSDMSTFDTTKLRATDGNTKPRYFVTAESAVEVSHSPSRRGGKKEATITLTDPPRPMSALTVTSSLADREETEDQVEGRDRDSILQTPPRPGTNKDKICIPQAIPEAPPLLLNKRGVSCTNLAHQQSTPPESSFSSHTTNNPTSPSSLLKGLWQKCVADCYCISNNKASSTMDPQQEEPEELDYFQFLPSCAEEEVLPDIVPKLCEQVKTGPPKVKTKALHHIAQLCDRDRAHNRIELVCSADRSKYDLVGVLCQLLQSPDVSYQNYRQALLILSNLTLPMENKAVLLLGPQRETVLQALQLGLTCQKQQQLEVHLVCAILYNLSFLQDGKTLLCNYGSLLRTLEQLVLQFQPFVAPQGSVSSTPAPIAASVERQTLRWTFGFVRNLCQDSVANAKAVGQTQIPRIALECVGYSARLCSSGSTNNNEACFGQWRARSLEDLALGLLVELALREEESDPLLRCAVLAPSLHEINCQHHLEPLLLEDTEGIHGMRAKAIVNRFDVGDMKNGTGGLVIPAVNKRDDSPAAGKRRRSVHKRKPTIASV